MMRTDRMVPQLQQQWQADAAPSNENVVIEPVAAETPAASDMDAAAVFASMFDELSHEEPQPTIEPAEGAPPATDEPVEGALPDPKTVAAKAPATPEGAPAATPPAGAAPPAATPQANDAVWEKFRKVLEAPLPEAAPAAPAPAPEPKVEYYSADEKALVDAYEKEWPEVSQAEMLKRRAEYRELTGYIFGEVGKQVGPVLQQLVSFMQDQGQRTHLAEVQAAVPDYGDIREKVTTWVDGQPGFLKTAYVNVINQGTPEDVAALIDLWRKDTAAPAGAPAAAPAVAAPAAKGAVPRSVIDALKPPVGKRTNVQTGGVIPSDDFEGAFDVFNRMAAAAT